MTPVRSNGKHDSYNGNWRATDPCDRGDDHGGDDPDDGWDGNRNDFDGGSTGGDDGGPPAGNGGPPNDPEIPVFVATDGAGRSGPALHGIDWWRHLNCYDQPVPVGKKGQHLPWTGWHPEWGPTLNFPASTGLTLVQKDKFIRKFERSPLFDMSTLHSDFTKRFPKFTCSDKTPKSLAVLQYAVLVAKHCHTYGVYCPPVHTVHNLDPCGWWFADLPEAVQDVAQHHMSDLLAGRLSDPSTNLRKYPVFSTVVDEPDGYSAFTELLRVGEHPRLHLLSSVPSIPIMRTGSIRSYHSDWSNYLYCLALSGEVLSDVYVARAFYAGLHNGFATVQSFLKSIVDSVHRNMEAPNSLQLHRILHTIARCGPELALPRGFVDVNVQDPNAPRAIRKLIDAQDDHAAAGGYSMDSEDVVRALMRQQRRSDGKQLCYFCRHPTDLHKRAECPLVKKLLQDPNYKELSVGLEAFLQRDQAVRALVSDMEPSALAALSSAANAVAPDDSSADSVDFQ